jgi:tripeptidyl-peptidase-1
VTAAGGTTHIPEVAVDFSGGGLATSCVALFRSGRVTTLFKLTRICFQVPAPEVARCRRGEFLKSLPSGTYAGLFNPKGRVRETLLSLGSEGETHGIFTLTLCIGIPDVSAQASNFRIFFRGTWAGIGGTVTSASSPSFAGLVALLNDARVAAG